MQCSGLASRRSSCNSLDSKLCIRSPAHVDEKLKVSPYPNLDRPGRRRGRVWGPVCPTLRGCEGYDPSIGRQQPDLGPGSRPGTPNQGLGYLPIPTVYDDAEGGSGDWFAAVYKVVVLHATCPATARSWTKVRPAMAWNPKIGFGFSPDSDRPGHRRGHKTGDPIYHFQTDHPALSVGAAPGPFYRPGKAPGTRAADLIEKTINSIISGPHWHSIRVWGPEHLISTPTI